MSSNEEKLSILEMIFSVVYVVYTVLHLFIYCYVGDRLVVEVNIYFQTIQVYDEVVVGFKPINYMIYRRARQSVIPFTRVIGTICQRNKRGGSCLLAIVVADPSQ